MIKFYLKILNKIFEEKTVYFVSAIVLIVNIIIRMFPSKFIDLKFLSYFDSINVQTIVPIKLFVFCDVYLLLIFLILIIYSVGIDFKNSMEDITLAIGGSFINKYSLRKIITLILVFASLYMVSFVNVYTLYLKMIDNKAVLISISEVLLCSFTTIIFMVSLSLFFIYVLREITISIICVVSYFLVEECLWRCKMFQKYGVLGHIYQYEDYASGELLKYKLGFIVISVILIAVTCVLSSKRMGLEWRIRSRIMK